MPPNRTNRTPEKTCLEARQERSVAEALGRPRFSYAWRNHKSTPQFDLAHLPIIGPLSTSVQAAKELPTDLRIIHRRCFQNMHALHISDQKKVSSPFPTPVQAVQASLVYRRSELSLALFPSHMFLP